MTDKLTYEYQLILNCISNVLFEREKQLNIKDVDIKKLFDEADKQAVYPIVYRALKSSIPDEYLAQIDFRNTLLLSKNAMVHCEHEELHRAIKHIPYVILKGLSSARYYKEPGLRTMGDVDFLVDKKDIALAQRVLEDAGFTKKEHDEHGAHIAYHRYPNSAWELHWSMSGIPSGKNGDVVRKYFSSTISTSVLVGNEKEEYRVPDDFHHGLILLIHNARHMINTGIGLRHLCDWAVFVDSVDDFEKDFKDKLTECGLYRFAQILTQLSSKYLGLKKQAWAEGVLDDSLLHSLILDIFYGGNFGVKDGDRINQAKFITDDKTGAVNDRFRFSQLFRVLTEKARNALPICSKCKLFLPIGWVYVLVRHMIRIVTKRRPKVKIKGTLKGAEERHNIYKEFKLFEK